MENIKSKMLSAKEAKKISDSKKPSLEEVVKLIEPVANEGFNSLLHQNLCPEVITELMRLGYKVTIHYDIINGIESHIVSW